MIRRVLAAIFGATLFGIALPIGYGLTYGNFPFEGSTGIAVVAGVGVILGGFLGLLFPRIFGWIVEFILEAFMI